MRVRSCRPYDIWIRFENQPSNKHKGQQAWHKLDHKQAEVLCGRHMTEAHMEAMQEGMPKGNICENCYRILAGKVGA